MTRTWKKQIPEAARKRKEPYKKHQRRGELAPCGHHLSQFVNGVCMMCKKEDEEDNWGWGDE